MEIIKKQPGGLKLVHEGYVYTKKYARKNVKWDCANHYAFSCKGGLTTVDIACSCYRSKK